MHKILAAGLFAAASFGAPILAAPPVYKLQSEVTLKGASPSWDYASFESGRGYLFLGRRAEGVTVVDSKSGAVVTTVADSKGANVALLVPLLDRGYTANGDGTTTIFQLSTLKTIQRVKLGEAADSAFFDPMTKQIVFTDGDNKELIFFDTGTDKVVTHMTMPAEELEGVVTVGDGTMWVNERDIDKVAHVDMHTHKLLAEHAVTGCTMPTGLAMDKTNNRLFIGCKGLTPVMAVVDAGSGKVIKTVEIGRGNDTVVFDPATKQIFASNGLDANIVVIDQVSADDYKFASAFTTRPICRTMAYDPATRRVFTITAQGMVDIGKERNLRAGSFYPNRYFDDTFTLLTYAPQ